MGADALMPDAGEYGDLALLRTSPLAGDLACKGDGRGPITSSTRSAARDGSPPASASAAGGSCSRWAMSDAGEAPSADAWMTADLGEAESCWLRLAALLAPELWVRLPVR